MITCPGLEGGRLGNHLFRMAATIGLARDHDEPYGFPRWKYEGVFGISGCFYDVLPEGPEYQEPRFCYDRISHRRNLRLSGLFQSEKYFTRHSRLVRSLLTPQSMPGRMKGVASLHVRRGDYLLYPDKHPILPMSYYEEAIGIIIGAGAGKILVFSDDLPWCREQFTRKPFEVIPDLSDTKQLALTIACEHQVMANSTFSWWGAWLNPNPDKIVIAPRAWFGPGYAHFDTKDLIPSEWKLL